MTRAWLLALVVGAVILYIATLGERGARVIGSRVPQPVIRTAEVASDPDDPAFWRHRTEPARSLIVATDKIEGRGGLYVFGLDGGLRQKIAPLDRPNNVDIEYGFNAGGQPLDIAVVTERNQRRLRIYRIPSDGGMLTDLVPRGLPVLETQSGDAAEPMGIGLYKRPRDGTVFAIVAPKTGEATNYLWQYRLESDSSGALGAVLVRRFGNFSRQGVFPTTGEIEAVVVDDELGYVYYADERFGIRKWHADPDHLDAARELAVLGRDGYRGDREGLAIFKQPGGKGYLLSTDQIAGGSRLKVFSRDGGPGGPHDHQLLGVADTEADDTDGIDVTAETLPGFPSGMLVMMNSGSKNFLVYRWEAVFQAMTLATP